MKQIYYFLIVCIFATAILSSCSKNELRPDTKFEPTALSLQILDPEPIVALEKGVYPVIASGNGSTFTKFTAEHMSDFEGFMAETTVLVPDDVTIDANGNFSRPVSTVVLRYPIQATGKAGDILTAKLTFIDTKGKSISTEASKIVVNFRTNNTKKYFYSSTPWYNFNKGISYNKNSIGTAEDDIKNNLEAFHKVKTGVQYMCSPDSDETASSFINNSNYDQSLAHHTRFIKLDNIQFGDVNDKVLESMDFANSVDVIELEDKTLYGVLLQDGRKAVLYATRYNATISQVISIYQVSP